jgi:RNA polymerase sigma factor (sigma-70 family)
VLQEVIASLKSYDSNRSSIKTWSRRIAWRLFADHCAKNRLKQNKTSHQIAHEEKYHLNSRLNRDACLAMVSEVASMEEVDRHLLQLFFEDGLTDTEVARILGITPDSARQKKRRLVQKLHLTLQTQQSHE